jgi:hypothetical protein
MSNHHKHQRGDQRRSQDVFQRIPLEDVRELWYWGIWKEPVPSEFSTTVIVVCTSREKCKRYAAIQTHDDWLDDESTDAPVIAPSENDRDLFDADGNEVYGDRRFRLMSFETFVNELRRQIARFSPNHRITLLVNPFERSNRQFAADGMYRADEFLRASGLDDSPIP